MTQPEFKLQVQMDSGSSHYFLNPRPRVVQRALSEPFPNLELEELIMMHSMAAGTLIRILIVGIGVGAGIVAAEFLKECGKDLWKAFKKMILKEKKIRDYVHGDPNLGDDVIIVLKAEPLSIQGLIRLRRGDNDRFEEFLTNGPSDLAEILESVAGGHGTPQNPNFKLPPGATLITLRYQAQRWVITGPRCPNCAHAALSVEKHPCSDCMYQGAKLDFNKNNIIYGADGSPVSIDFGHDEIPWNDHYEPVEGPRPNPLPWHRC